MFIRKMTVDDIDRILVLEEQLFTSSSWTLADFIYEIVDNQFSYNYVLENDDLIIGYAGLWIMYEQSQITTIGIDLQYQGQGLGKKLMNEMIALAIEAGCTTMSLEVRISNVKAIQLYESVGFKKATIRKDYYQNNHEDAYLMVKGLEG